MNTFAPILLLAVLSLGTSQISAEPLVFEEDQCEMDQGCVRLTLGSKAVWTIKRVSQNSYLNINLKQLRAMDPDGWVSVVEEARIPNSTESRLLISAPYSSPSFQKILIGVQEVESGTNKVLEVARFELEVVPVLEIRFYGSKKGYSSFDSPDLIQLQPHSKPVQLKMINTRETDTSHRMHGEGAIQHQRFGASMTKVGDAYEQEVSVTDLSLGIYYCHDHDSGKAKKIYFNQQNQQELRAAIQYPDALLN